MKSQEISDERSMMTSLKMDDEKADKAHVAIAPRGARCCLIRFHYTLYCLFVCLFPEMIN